MQTILLAIDFSDGIENCCNYAIRVASRFDAEIILFHSYFDKFLITESSFPTGIEAETLINKKILDDIKLQAEKDLKNITSCIVDSHPAAKIKSVLIGGNPEEEILTAADNFKADLLILGSSGKAEKGIFSGSVTKKIMENSQIPVLSIPLDYTYKEIKNILYPTEFLHNDSKIILKIFNLLSKFDIKMHCVHLINHEKADSSDLIEKIQLKLKDKINEDLICFENLKSDNFIDTLQNYTEEHQINLIAFVVHKRGFLREIFTHKLTKKDLFHLKLPMLAIKA